MPSRKNTAPALLAAWLVGALFCASAGATGHGKHPKDAPTLKQDFRKLDKNGDGYLSMEEFKVAGLATVSMWKIH